MGKQRIKVIKTSVPDGSLAAGLLPADHSDAYMAGLRDDAEFTPDDFLTSMWTKKPPFADFMFKLRNVLVKPFGLKSGKEEGTPEELAGNLRKGKPAGLTSVTAKSDDETVIYMDDKHLGAYLSVYIADNGGHKALYLSTVVIYHKKLGRAYFAVIRPFHAVIVKRMLRYTLNQFTENGR